MKRSSRTGNWSAMRARKRTRDAFPPPSSQRRKGKTEDREKTRSRRRHYPCWVAERRDAAISTYRLPYVPPFPALFLSLPYISLSLSLGSTPTRSTRSTFRVFQLSTLRRFRPFCHYPLLMQNCCRERCSWNTKFDELQRYL